MSFRRVSGSFKSVNDQNDVFKLLFAYIDILNSNNFKGDKDKKMVSKSFLLHVRFF